MSHTEETSTGRKGKEILSGYVKNEIIEKLDKAPNSMNLQINKNCRIGM